MDITEAIIMGDKILGKLTEDAALLEEKVPDGGLEASNTKRKPLKDSIDSNREKELDLESKVKNLKLSKQYAKDEKSAASIDNSIKAMQAQIAGLKSDRKKSKNMLASISEAADIPDPKAKDDEPEESDDDLRKDAKEFDADLKESSGLEEGSDSTEMDITKAKANAVIKACENEKVKIKSYADAKIQQIETSVDRKVDTINQKEKSAKDMKSKVDAQKLSNEEAEKDQEAAESNDQQADNGQQEESMEINDGSAQIQEAFENIRLHIIHSKIDKLTNKANAIQEKINKGNLKDEKVEKLKSKLEEINSKLVALTGSDLSGKQVGDFSNTKYGKVNADINKKAVKKGLIKNSGYIQNKHLDDSYSTEDLYRDLDALNEECDALLSESDDPSSQKEEKQKPAEEKEEKVTLSGEAKRIYDCATGAAKCDEKEEAAILKLKKSFFGSAVLAKIKDELAKPNPSKAALMPLQSELMKNFDYIYTGGPDIIY